MAALRAAFRSAPRAQILRPSPAARIAPTVQQRTAVSVIGRRPATDQKSAEEAEQGSEDLVMDDTDPNMNGNYPDPSLTSALPIKRQHRDPYADWWDPIERRNYGETVHEDNDILGVFSTEDYTHFSAGWGGVLWLYTIGAFGVMAAVVYRYYPGRPSAPRTFPGGLEEELGGAKAVRARKVEEEESIL